MVASRWTAQRRITERGRVLPEKTEIVWRVQMQQDSTEDVLPTCCVNFSLEYFAGQGTARAVDAFNLNRLVRKAGSVIGPPCSD